MTDLSAILQADARLAEEARKQARKCLSVPIAVDIVPALCARLDAYREAVEIATNAMSDGHVYCNPKSCDVAKALAEVAAKLGGCRE